MDDLILPNISRTELSDIIFQGYAGPILNAKTMRILSDAAACRIYDTLLNKENYAQTYPTI